MGFKGYHTVNGRILGETSGGTRTDYLTDALGSVTATVNSAAVVVNTYRHKPYGTRLAKTGIGSDPGFQWSGNTGSKPTGRALSQQYNRKRHYSSWLSVWTAVDSLWPRQPQYVYCMGRPTTFVDPLGMLACQQSPCNPDLGLWPPCSNASAIRKCFEDNIPDDRCPGGNWTNCPTPPELRLQCKGGKESCDAIAKRIKDIGDVINGIKPDDTKPGIPWDAVTGCCTKEGGWGSATLCCSSGAFFGQPDAKPPKPKINPCVGYCLLKAHEQGGHKAQCEARSPDIGVGPGGRTNELNALACELDCLRQAQKALSCPEVSMPTFTRPAPGCSAGDQIWFR